MGIRSMIRGGRGAGRGDVPHSIQPPSYNRFHDARTGLIPKNPGKGIDWYDEGFEGAGTADLWTKLPQGAPTFYGTYSNADYSGGTDLPYTSNKEGQILRPPMPPTRPAGLAGRVLQKFIGSPDQTGIEIVRKPSRANRAQYVRNLGLHAMMYGESVGNPGGKWPNG